MGTLHALRPPESAESVHAGHVCERRQVLLGVSVSPWSHVHLLTVIEQRAPVIIWSCAATFSTEAWPWGMRCTDGMGPGVRAISVTVTITRICVLSLHAPCATSYAIPSTWGSPIRRMAGEGVYTILNSCWVGPQC